MGPTLPQGVPPDLYLEIPKLPTLNFEPPDQWKSWGVKWGKTKNDQLESKSESESLRFGLYLPILGTHTYFEKLWGKPRWIEIEENSPFTQKRIWINEKLGFKVSMQEKLDYHEPGIYVKIQPSTLLYFEPYTPLNTLIGNPLKIGHFGFEPQNLMGLSYQEIVDIISPNSISISKLITLEKSKGYADLNLPATEINSKETQAKLFFLNEKLYEIRWSLNNISDEDIDTAWDQYLKAFSFKKSSDKRNFYKIKTPSRHYSLAHTDEDIIVFVTKINDNSN